MLRLEDGRPLILEPFQRDMLTELFAGTRELLILLPKKNGKSSVLGALALYHLCTTPDAECVIAAASRDQAQIMLRQAQGYIRRSPALQARLAVKQREVVHRTLGGRVRVLASDVDTADGVIPTLALVDELHRHRSADLYGVFRDGLGPRNGQIVTISTAGSDPGSPLGLLRERAHTLTGFRRQEAHNHAISDDGQFVLHEWALGQSDDLDDLELVKQANPASWQTIEKLRARHDSPSMTASQWARFACNVWTHGEESWLPEGAWEACRDPEATIPERSPVVLGVDVGTKRDTSAIARLWRREDGRIVVEAEVFEPVGDGSALELAVVERALRANADRYEVLEVVYDRWSFERSAQELADEGLLMVEVPQSAERMSVASATVYQAITEKLLVHNGDPTLTAHVLSGATKPHERGWRLVKNKSRRPIDALIAMTIALTEIDRMSASGRMEWF